MLSDVWTFAVFLSIIKSIRSPEDMEVVRFIMDKDARLQKVGMDAPDQVLLCEALDVFVVEYDFRTGELYIDPRKDHYIKLLWTREDIMQRRLDDLVFRPDIPKLEAFLDIQDMTPDHDKREITVRLFTDVHQYAWFRLDLVLRFDQERKRTRALAAISNVDDVTEMERQLKYHTERDYKTPLLHESAFVKRVRELLAGNPDVDYRLILMNIEHFHLITGMFGVEEGDNLLRYLAVKIQEYMDEEEGTVQCRIASEHFAMLVPVPKYSVSEVIDYLERAVFLYPNICNISLSFGVYPITEEERGPQASVRLMIERAMAASATVRDNYMRHVAFYDSAMRSQEEREMKIINRMRAALEQEQYLVYLQPRVEMDSGRITGAEALVRWQYSADELITPGEFIPIFEKNGFIIELDYYMVEHICRIIRRWLDTGIPALPISVNLSRINLYNPKLLSGIDACVEKYRIPRNLIEFELTESEFAAENKYMVDLVENLSRRGFEVYLDDFGSGYSSLNALKEIPADGLKIDSRFLSTDGDRRKADLILEYIVQMAKAMEVKITVEGVEDAEQAEFLLGIGCSLVQGFYYYRPMPVEEYEESIRQKPVSLKERKLADIIDHKNGGIMG